MKKNSGFTLIELLVVVLIIGILSSIALPQYTRAVNRARSTEALIAGKAIADAQNLYWLANSKYDPTFWYNDGANLDIQYPELKYFTLGTANTPGCESGVNATTCYFAFKPNDGAALLIYKLYRGHLEEYYCQNDPNSKCTDYFSCTVGSGGRCDFN